MNARIINAPRPEVMHMLERRMTPDARTQLRERSFDAVGLVQTSVPDVYFYADLAQKASNVFAVELFGSCPQHITTLAFFGETSAVRTAMQAIQNEARNCV
ncbi:BMC domain-containing protein [Telmatospirillum sp.]|uniref:BMC domain-containing protein n=1 Tax=Telmatospirillum sp. TaxID=2079197 RepID=UPI00284BE822|nr:BMC domain-containing protein [Telmatospirillum sp.]MDR3438607.1 BMC domain-containing protein [Telmatospirillum sp.]